MRPNLPVLASILLLTACGGSSVASTGHSPPSAPKGTIMVTNTYSDDPSDGIQIEGAMTEVLLFDAGGALLATKTASPGKPLTFAHLRPGDYVLRPAIRPCDGNCGYLDGRMDGCQATVHLADSLQVRVTYQVGSPCTIDPLT